MTLLFWLLGWMTAIGLNVWALAELRRCWHDWRYQRRPYHQDWTYQEALRRATRRRREREGAWR